MSMVTPWICALYIFAYFNFNFSMLRRWRLFGHILRQDKNIPGNQAMLAFFQQEGTKRRGRQKTSIISVLRQDLKKIYHKAALKFKTTKDLEKLRHIG